MVAQLNEPLARAIFVATTAGDAFFLNLLWVMLKVAEPFTKGGLVQAGKVDPTYATVGDAELLPQAWEQYGGPVFPLASESKLVPLEQGVLCVLRRKHPTGVMWCTVVMSWYDEPHTPVMVLWAHTSGGRAR